LEAETLERQRNASYQKRHQHYGTSLLLATNTRFGRANEERKAEPSSHLPVVKQGFDQEQTPFQHERVQFPQDCSASREQHRMAEGLPFVSTQKSVLN
jgi:hypothetical protein